MESQDFEAQLQTMGLDGLTVEFCKLWPRLEQQECPVAQVCYFIHKALKANGKRRAGVGVKQWCIDHGIPLWRFNYLKNKGTPESELEKKGRDKMMKRVSDAVNKSVCAKSTNSSLFFEEAWENLKRCIKRLPVPEELEKHRVIEQWQEERIRILRYQTRTPLVGSNSNTAAAMPLSGISHEEALHGEQAS
jgi:hypothetical protein